MITPSTREQNQRRGGCRSVRCDDSDSALKHPMKTTRYSKSKLIALILVGMCFVSCSGKKEEIVGTVSEYGLTWQYRSDFVNGTYIVNEKFVLRLKEYPDRTFWFREEEVSGTEMYKTLAARVIRARPRTEFFLPSPSTLKVRFTDTGSGPYGGGSGLRVEVDNDKASRK